MTVLFSILLSANAPGKAMGDDPSTWVLDIHMEDPDGVSDSWLRSCSVLAFVDIWGVNQGLEELFLIVFLFIVKS